MSLNKILLGNGSVPKLSCEFKSVSCDEDITAESVNAETCFSTEYSQSGGDIITYVADARFTLGDVVPVNFVSSVGNSYSLRTIKKKAFDIDGGDYSFTLGIKGNFELQVGIVAGAEQIEYSITINGIDAVFHNSLPTFFKGSGIAEGGVGVLASSLTDIDTSIQGEIKLTFENKTHANTPNASIIINDFDIELIEN